MMAASDSLKMPRGRRFTVSLPLESMLLLLASTPTTAFTVCTAGSASTTRAAACCSSAMRSNDTSGDACTRPCSCPVLCVGNSDLGIAQYSTAVSTSVASATSSVKPWRASTHCRPRS